MQTSARNQFLGTVKAITKGAVNAEVILDIGNSTEIAAIITNSSVDHLDLAVGKEAYALVKAHWVILSLDTHFKTSARNTLTGTITRVVDGATNTDVTLELPGGQNVAAIITNESAQRLHLEAGKEAQALIKASHIILAVPA
jgi:molybdate transport system regulatory protein